MQCGIGPCTDFLMRQAQVLGSERHILLNRVAYDLVFGILEHHAHRAADLPEGRAIGGG